jgi:hypothetical protein
MSDIVFVRAVVAGMVEDDTIIARRAFGVQTTVVHNGELKTVKSVENCRDTAELAS